MAGTAVGIDHELVKSITSIIQTITSVVIPIVVLLVGLKINKSLESAKAALSREKDWKTKWAEHFYEAAIGFSGAVSRAVMLLSQLQEIANSKTPDEDATKQKQDALIAGIHDAFHSLAEQEWLLRTQLHFARKSAPAVRAAVHQIMDELRSIVETHKGSFDSLHEHQRIFFEASRSAHREILESSSQ